MDPPDASATPPMAPSLTKGTVNAAIRVSLQGLMCITSKLAAVNHDYEFIDEVLGGTVDVWPLGELGVEMPL